MYLIDKKALFDHVSGRLQNASEEIMLGENSKACLKLLIDNQGDIVSKNTILDEVWTAKGIVVSDNAVRQTMHIVRKSITQLTSNSQLITTIPRNGYMIVGVEEISAEDQSAFLTKRSGRSFWRSQTAKINVSGLMYLIWPGYKGLAFSIITTVASFSAYFYVTSSQEQGLADVETSQPLQPGQSPAPHNSENSVSEMVISPLTTAESS